MTESTYKTSNFCLTNRTTLERMPNSGSEIGKVVGFHEAKLSTYRGMRGLAGLVSDNPKDQNAYAFSVMVEVRFSDGKTAIVAIDRLNPENGE